MTMKDMYIMKLQRFGFGVIDNTGYLDIVKDDYHSTVILDDETEQEQIDSILNYELFKKREYELNQIEGIRVGDFVRFPDGSVNRVTYIWECEDYISIQTGGGGSYYLGNDGHMSYSGGLDLPITGDHFGTTREKKKGYVWFFKDDHMMAHNGITYEMEFRVFVVDCYPGNDPNKRGD